MSRRKITCPIRGSQSVGLLQKVKVAVEVAQPTNQIKNKCCAKHGCNKMGSKLCSSCNDESYCSPECQKLDWKIHKIICSKQSGQLLPFEEAMERFSKLVNESFGKSIENRLRILLYLQKFSEYQFEGFMDKPGSSRRTDGGNTSNDMVVDIKILNWIYFQLGTAYQPITKNGTRTEWTTALSYYEKSIKILEPYRQLLMKLDFSIEGSNKTDDSDDLTTDFDCLSYRRHGLKSPLITDENFGSILEALSKTEDSLGGCHAALGNYSAANDFYSRAILHARKYNGEKSKKLELLCQSLMNMGGLFNIQNNPNEAMVYIQEAVAIKIGSG
mmetsp:Transcript_11263/g.10893  ORF Transcript_11263/g.10893 Transcript_11263/m.10893 type:complete len:329 (+) Transcript_11263:104-1090(+)